MGEQRDDQAHGLGRGPQTVEHCALGGRERLVAGCAQKPLVLTRVAAHMALASLTSGGARQIGAEYRRGVHDGPPGCAWKHCQEKYVWTPVSFAILPHHVLVWSYQQVRNKKKPFNLRCQDWY